MIFKLNKAIYGLIESAMLWYEHLKETLLSLGYTCLDADRGVFVRKTKHGRSTLCIHVDDILASSSHPSLERNLLEGLRRVYKEITLHEGNHLSYIGMAIDFDRDAGIVEVSQPGYIDELLKEYGVTKTFKSPTTNNFLSPDPGAKTIDISPNRHKVMQLSYLSGRSRPDLSFAISCLTHHLNAPTTDDERDTDRLLGYLKHSKDLKLRFHPTSMSLRCYADASYAIHPDMRSHMGVVLCLGDGPNAPFLHKSAAIKTIVRSSTEAEIHALNELLSDCLHEADLLNELGHLQDPIIVYEDKEAAIKLLERPGTNYQTKSKHIKVRFASFKEHLDREFVVLKHCPTEDMLADIHTKPLSGSRFFLLRDRLMGHL